jgi:sec-independent protein translocase protein TatA
MVLILNDLAGSEILLILVFVLIFFGSKSIPGLAKTMGRTIRQVKDASADIQNEIKKSGADMKKDLNLTGIIEDTARDIKQPLDQYAQDIDNAVKYQPQNKKTHMIPPDQNLGSENENAEDTIVKDDQVTDDTRNSVDAKENSENLNSDESGKI